MYLNNKIVIGKSDNSELYIVPKMANRHGLITGASGSGKTTTVKVMAESFSSAGIPVFYVDVKGDLASICKMGEDNQNINERLKRMGVENFIFNVESDVYVISVFSEVKLYFSLFNFPFW